MKIPSHFSPPPGSPRCWIVRVKSGGEVIRVKGSDAHLEQLEHDKAGFEAMLKNIRTP